MSGILGELSDALGILPRHRDQTGIWHETSDATRRAILSAMEVDTGSQATLEAAHAALQDHAARRRLADWIVCVADRPGPGIEGDWVLTLEDGQVVEGRDALPVLPLGIHCLSLGGEVTWLLSAPETLPEPARTWGVTLPLYGLRPAEQGGIGSYRDLATVAQGLAELGAGFVGINPVHAGFPCDPMAFSPYAPSSRRRFSTLHIDAGAAVAPGGALIDYPAVTAAQDAALRRAWEARRPDPDFDAWRTREGAALERFALHQALSDVHGAYWTGWPAEFHDPSNAAVTAFAHASSGRIAYHAWLQYRAETQLAEVRCASNPMALGLYLDLAVGTHPEGAETWGDPHLFARGVSLGAPPDAFSRGGQRWNLAPMRPLDLARDGFRGLAGILRAQLRFAGVLRIDHILGFERAFWVPEDAPGAYVRMPKAALLAVARIEAARVGAVIVGEDLGNIPEGLHRDLDASGILGCRVTMFEQDWDAAEPVFRAPGAYDRQVLTAFGSHDLPTWRGWRRGTDIHWRGRLGSLDCAAQTAAMEHRRAEVAGLERAMGGRSVERLNGFLAETPSRLVALQAEDLLGLIEQPNLPGTVYDHPNWRRRLGVAPGALARHPGIVKAAQIMETAGR